jgi:hypothetical protein
MKAALAARMERLPRGRENENHLRVLLNSLLHRHLRRIGCVFQRSLRHYFVNKPIAEDAPVHRKWTNVFALRSYTQLVAKFHTFVKQSFCKHPALDARFERFADQGAIGIYPQLQYPTDGTKL